MTLKCDLYLLYMLLWLVYAISCINHSTTFVFGSTVWSKTINLPNMSLKDSPGTCIAIEEGFVLCSVSHE